MVSLADLAELKWSLLTVLAMLCTGSGAIAISGHMLGRAQAQHDALQAQLQLATRELAIAREDEANLQIYAPEFKQLQLRNVVDGNHPRLGWIEGLDKIYRQRWVLNFRYTLLPQQNYVPPESLAIGPVNASISSMTLNLDLLHEVQLTQFFDALDAEIPGWFMLDHCAVERQAAPENDEYPADAIPLKAECSGGWLSLQNEGRKS